MKAIYSIIIERRVRGAGYCSSLRALLAAVGGLPLSRRPGLRADQRVQLFGTSGTLWFLRRPDRSRHLCNQPRPAAYDCVIGVGMVNSAGIVDPKSQRNESVFVTAPGSGVLVWDMPLLSPTPRGPALLTRPRLFPPRLPW
jgi:hypothetical protein